MNLLFPILIITSDLSVGKARIRNQTFIFNLVRTGISGFFFLVILIFFVESPIKKISKINTKKAESEVQEPINEQVVGENSQKIDIKSFFKMIKVFLSDKIYLSFFIGFSFGYSF